MTDLGIRLLIEKLSWLPYEMSVESRTMLVSFFTAMLDKWVEAERKHGWQDAWLQADPKEIQADLLKHVGKGDPRDVAIYCAICHHFGWQTVSKEGSPPSGT